MACCNFVQCTTCMASDPYHWGVGVGVLCHSAMACTTQFFATHETNDGQIPRQSVFRSNDAKKQNTGEHG